MDHPEAICFGVRQTAETPKQLPYHSSSLVPQSDVHLWVTLVYCQMHLKHVNFSATTLLYHVNFSATTVFYHIKLPSEPFH